MSADMSEISSSTSGSSSLTSDEETDIRDLKPIKDYLSNRTELAHQLFKSVKPEKIRMMLPQALKKIGFKELEEWCVSELNGMSATRITKILNGHPMLESSDTNESDDSGPSLEIISDTEEWLTDEETSRKDDHPMRKSNLKKDQLKTKNRNILKGKNCVDKLENKSQVLKTESANGKNKINVKKEGEDTNDNNKINKEGDSLLDLLELEMRARAIRALIRKEDDVIPNSGSKVDPNRTKVNISDISEEKIRQLQLGNIISSQQSGLNEDEDVVLVVQPTPTIELISSESESDEHGKRVNKKLKNERGLICKTSENVTVVSSCIQSSLSGETLHENEELGIKIVVDQITSGKNSNSSDDSQTKTKSLKTKHELKNINENIDTESVGRSSPQEQVQLDKSEETEQRKMISPDVRNQLSDMDKVTKTNEEERSMDLEEIIDLDDYPDDMDVMDSLDSDEIIVNKVIPNEDGKQQLSEEDQPTNSTSSETWATRYYQTNDVQSVMRESKIQSEIRKRLRERQRLAKLRPTSSSSSLPSDEISPQPEEKPKGSVEEYLALKPSTSTSGTDTLEENKNVDSEGELIEKIT